MLRLTPRYLGCAAVISRSFARIHETNLKKQGVLTLTFQDPSDYEKITEYDRISITGLQDIRPSKPVKCFLHHSNGIDEEIVLAGTHITNPRQNGFMLAQLLTSCFQRKNRRYSCY